MFRSMYASEKAYTGRVGNHGSCMGPGRFAVCEGGAGSRFSQRCKSLYDGPDHYEHSGQKRNAHAGKERAREFLPPALQQIRGGSG